MIWKFVFTLIIVFLVTPFAHAVRLKDIANVRGVRDNQLVGYGLVVGLKGTGDSKSDFTNKSMKRMLEKMGIKVDDEQVAKKNVAAVMVTATLPPFARAGNRMDVTVSSIGDASSLEGGILVQSPLKAADQTVYAAAQGAISVGKSAKSGHTTVGFVTSGALIEKDIQQESFTNRKMYRLTLHNPDITTVARITQTINMDLGGKYATPVDPATVDIVVPFAYEGKGVELLATIESLNVEPDTKAKVVVNEKSGTVIIGENVRISTVAISHGDINLKVGAQAPPAPPPPVLPPQEPVSLRAPASLGSDIKKQNVKLLNESVSVGELVESLNQMGVSPKDLIIILQNVKASGALQGELEIL